MILWIAKVSSPSSYIIISFCWVSNLPSTISCGGKAKYLGLQRFWSRGGHAANSSYPARILKYITAGSLLGVPFGQALQVLSSIAPPIVLAPEGLASPGVWLARHGLEQAKHQTVDLQHIMVAALAYKDPGFPTQVDKKARLVTTKISILIVSSDTLLQISAGRKNPTVTHIVD